MAIGFYYPTIAAPSAQWIPSRQPGFESTKTTDYVGQLLGTTAGGSVYVQDKGIQKTVFDLRFSYLAQADRYSALAIYNAAKKALNTLEYKDGDGIVHSVRWMNEFNFKPEQGGRYSASILLRED